MLGKIHRDILLPLAGTTEAATEVRRQDALLKTGALQSAIFNSANFSSIATDAKGVIQIFNVGAERMLGYAAAEVMNKITPADISDPEELVARAEALSIELGTTITPGFEALVFKASRGIEDIYELTYIRKDGSRFPAMVSVTALRDAQDAIIGYLLIGTDNTARKEAEEALLKAGALQSAIFNSANFSSIATDAKGVIQIFNVGAERMLGYSAAEVMNKITPADISDPEELVARAEALSIELGTTITPGFEALVFKASRGIEDIYELTKVRKDGSRFPAMVSVTALRDAQDAIIGYLLIGTDNTARKEADRALREHHALLRTIHLHSIVSVTDRRDRIGEVNDRFCSLSGYSRDELLGQTHNIVNSGTQDRAFWTDMWHTIVAGKPWRGDICNRAKDGSLYWVDSIIAPFRGQDGGMEKYISISTDVTAARLIALDLQQANADLEEFSSVASHDLRSPLRGISDLVEWISEDLGEAEEAVRLNLDRVRLRVKRMEGVIDDLLAYARAGRASAELAMVDPAALIKGILEMQPLPPDFEMALTVEAAPFRTARTPLETALRNLIANAVKHHDRAIGHIAVTVVRDGNYYLFTVADDGPGIPPTAHERIFKLFQTLGSSQQEVSGIGLAVTKRLIEGHGGRIELESNEDRRGATFRFWWPCFVRKQNHD
jgi:PAS domain S-box-containing protein